MLSELQYAQAIARARAEAARHATGIGVGARRTWQSVAEQMLILDRDWSSYLPLQWPYLRLALMGAFDVAYHSRDADSTRPAMLPLINVRRRTVPLPAVTQQQLDDRIDELLLTYPVSLPDDE
jgi:hypothetical protein